MMRDTPDAAAILAAVSGALGRAEAPSHFERRVLASAVDIARREIEEPVAKREAEREALATLLGREGSVDELTTVLASGIASGEIEESPDLMGLLWRVTLSKVAIDQPRFALFRRLTEQQNASS